MVLTAIRPAREYDRLAIGRERRVQNAPIDIFTLLLLQMSVGRSAGIVQVQMTIWVTKERLKPR